MKDDHVISRPHGTFNAASIQVNMRAGRLPPAEVNGVRYLKVPIELNEDARG
jgi:hypothetical protein